MDDKYLRDYYEVSDGDSDQEEKKQQTVAHNKESQAASTCDKTPKVQEPSTSDKLEDRTSHNKILRASQNPICSENYDWYSDKNKDAYFIVYAQQIVKKGC